MSLKILLLVGSGSFLGGIFRYLIATLFIHRHPHNFPWGTWIVNILGCLLIGILYGYSMRWPMAAQWRMFLAIGVLGGFTTFSAFSIETLTLYENGRILSAVLYVLSSVLIGLLATGFGYNLFRLQGYGG